MNPVDVQVDAPIQIRDFWLLAFWNAAGRLLYPPESAPAGDRGASSCADFADAALREAQKRGVMPTQLK